MDKTYTQEQLEFQILKHTTSELGEGMQRVERRLDSIDTHMKTQFNNFTNYILGIYGLLLGAALAHLKGVF